MQKQTVIKTIFSLTLSVAVFAAGWYANDRYGQHPCNKETRLKLRNFAFISPLIDHELPDGYNVKGEPIPFKQKISDFVEQQIHSGQVAEMSVYFRDLSDGPWFGINEDVRYNPASMMKVPILVAWLKRAENDPSVLRHKFVFDEKAFPGPPQHFKPSQELKSGVAYTVDELLRYMMYYSDNRAYWLLFTNLVPGEYDTVLSGMDVNNDQDENGKVMTTVHGYSGFLRILYNATFLNKEMSEKALRLMSFEDFPRGIVAGMPKGTKLASKFGEYSDDKNPTVKQLHEFAIVYHPKGPYILGILTRGKNLDTQAEIIRTVSEMVYNSFQVQSNSADSPR